MTQPPKIHGRRYDQALYDQALYDEIDPLLLENLASRMRQSPIPPECLILNPRPPIQLMPPTFSEIQFLVLYSFQGDCGRWRSIKIATDEHRAHIHVTIEDPENEDGIDTALDELRTILPATILVTAECLLPWTARLWRRLQALLKS